MEATILRLVMIASLIYLFISFFLPKKESDQVSSSPFSKGDLILSFLLIGYLYLLTFLSGDNPSKDPLANVKTGKDLIIIQTLIIGQLAILLPAVVIFFRLVVFPRHRQAVGWLPGPDKLRNLIILPVLAVAACVVPEFIAEITGISDRFAEWIEAAPEQWVMHWYVSGSGTVKFILFLCVVLVAPFIEELMFRGFLYPTLTRYIGRVPSIVFVSVLFGVIHAHAVAFIFLTFFGFLMIILYDRTKTIWAPIAAHFLMNASNLAVLHFWPQILT